MREVTGRHREIGSRAAKGSLHFSVRALQTIECHRTDDQ